MLRFVLLLTVAMTVTSVNAQETLDYFDQINISGRLHVTLVQADDNSIDFGKTAAGDINYEIDHGVLKISKKELWNPSSYDELLDLKIMYRKVREINAAAGAVVDHPSTIALNDLSLHFDTGAKGTFNVNIERLEARAGEGGLLKLSGEAETFDGKAVTGGNIKAGELKCIRAFVNANTGGFISVYATETLEAQASIGGNINYRGKPENLDIRTNLGGYVNSME